MGQQVKAAQNADKVHAWPVEAGGCDDESWAIYVKNQCVRAFDDWNDADLVELASVSKMQAMVVNEMEKLETEGFIVMGGKAGTTPVENPRNRAISTARSGITSTLRRLGITSMSVADKRSQANRGKQERDARGVISQGDDNERSRSGTALM